MTRLTPEQFARVAQEVASMLSDGDHDEAWRVLKMFADGQFKLRLSDFPVPLQEAHARLGPVRRRNYAALPEELRSLVAGDEASVFEFRTFGAMAFEGRRYEFVKLASRNPTSLYEARLPICFVSGVHGDEPDGVFATIQFARRFARSRELASTYSLTIYPCINPVGYERMTRANGQGKDLNREFQRHSQEAEVRIMERELGGQAFTGFISGHSDYESFGVYAYATGAVLSERLAKPALFQVSHIIPINTDPVIDGQPAQFGIINQKFPGSLGPLTRGKTEPFDITIETPNLFALRKRVQVQALAFETILQEYRAVASEGMYL